MINYNCPIPCTSGVLRQQVSAQHANHPLDTPWSQAVGGLSRSTIVSAYLLEERQVLHRSQREHVEQIRAELVDVAQVDLQVRLALSVSLQKLFKVRVDDDGEVMVV